MITDHPVELDEHRGMTAQRLTEIRRTLHEVQADQAVLRRRHEEFERHAVAVPSTTWTEAATKARYLIRLFAGTPAARDPRDRSNPNIGCCAETGSRAMSVVLAVNHRGRVTAARAAWLLHDQDPLRSFGARLPNENAILTLVV